ncbi:MAG: NusG domain II-containing protein [Clostridium sp.]
MKFKLGGNSMVKKWDIILIVILLIFSFTPEFILGSRLKGDYDSTYAQITIGGKLYKNIPLSVHKGEETIEIKGKYGTNIIKIRNSALTMIDATCPDKVCMTPEYISKPGQNIVCLPNRVMVEIKGESEDDIIFSY